MVNDLARRQIRAAARQAIARAGVAGIVPTPLDVVGRSAGIAETLDLTDVPDDLVARRPSALQRVLGAVLYRRRLIVVDRSQSAGRARFIEGHEISHKILPWHETIIRLDDEARIFGKLKREIEHEADVGAAELLFQGDLFVRRALEYKVSINAPIGLAPDFGTSITAAVRQYAEYHPDRVAVLVAGRYASGGRVPVWHGHQSPSFRTDFGEVRDLFPGGLPASDADGAGDLGATVRRALDVSEVATCEITVPDRQSASRKLVLEAFCNQYVLLVMLREVRTRRTVGRGIRIVGVEASA